MKCNVYRCKQRATRRVEAVYESPFAFSGPVSGISYMCLYHADHMFERASDLAESGVVAIAGAHRPLVR